MKAESIIKIRKTLENADRITFKKGTLSYEYNQRFRFRRIKKSRAIPDKNRMKKTMAATIYAYVYGTKKLRLTPIT